MSQENLGSSIDDVLKEEGLLEEAQAQAVKEVVAWQVAEVTKTRKNSTNKDGSVAQEEPFASGPST